MTKKNNKYKKLLFLFFSLLCGEGMAADESDQGFQIVHRGSRVNDRMQSLLNRLGGPDAEHLSQSHYRMLLKWHEARQIQSNFLDNALDAAAEQVALLQMVSELSAHHSHHRRRHRTLSGDAILLSSSARPSSALRTHYPATEGDLVVSAHGTASDRDGAGITYFSYLPLEVIDYIVSLGGAEAAARLGLTCRGFYARYGRFCSLMTRAQRPLPIVDDMSTDMKCLWWPTLARTQALNLRGGWETPAQAHDFWNVFMDRRWGVPVARLDLSLNRMSYSVIANRLDRLVDGPNRLSELVLDDLRFGTRGLGNFDIEFDAFCTQIAGIPSLKRLSLRRCGLSERHLEALMDSLFHCRHLSLDLKGNYIDTLDHPQGHIVDTMSLVVEELNLGNNPFDVASLVPLLGRHRTSLQRLYVRDVGAQSLQSCLSLLSALSSSQLTALDIRDNPDMNSGTFVSRVIRGAPVLDTLAAGMMGGRARPRLPLFEEGTSNTMRPKSRLRTLTFGQDLLDEDVDHFMSFSGNKRHLRHVVLEGAISPKSVGRFFEMALLREMDLQNPRGFREEDWRSLAGQVWQHRTFDTMDLRAVPGDEHASLVHFVTGLIDNADRTLDMHKAQQARARAEIEEIRPGCRHGKQYTNLQRKVSTIFVPKRLTVKLPHNLGQTFDWEPLDWLTLIFAAPKEDGY